MENNVTGENTETSVSGQTEVQQTKEWRDFYGLKAFRRLPKGLNTAIMMILARPEAMAIQTSSGA